MFAHIFKSRLLLLPQPAMSRVLTGCVVMSFSSGTSATNNITIHQVSQNIKLRKQNDHSKMHSKDRPHSMVLLFPFLGAPSRVMDAYCSLYHSQNLDVIELRCEIQSFLWPSHGRRIARELLDYLSGNDIPLHADGFFVHAMSIGAYIWTLVLMEAVGNEAKYGPVLQKVNGQVFDSIVIGGVNRMVRGVAMMVGNKWTHNPIIWSAKLYLLLTKPFTLDLYEKGIEAFKKTPVKTPVLFFYSLNDPLSSSEAIQQDLLIPWRQDGGFDVHVKCFERSDHAAHLRDHPEQYVKTLHTFLRRLGVHHQPPSHKL